MKNFTENFTGKFINCRYCNGLGQNYDYKQEQKAQSFACLKCGGTGIEKNPKPIQRFRYTNLDVD